MLREGKLNPSSMRENNLNPDIVSIAVLRMKEN